MVSASRAPQQRAESSPFGLTVRPGPVWGEWQLWLLVGWILALLSPELVLGRTLFLRDLQTYYAGAARLLHQHFTTLTWPLWNPLLNGGQAALGDPNPALLYPSRLLYGILPTITALNWEIALHLVLGAVGAYVLSRRLGLARSASLAAGAVFSLTGFSVSLTCNVGRLFAYEWMPWAVFAGPAATGPGRRRWTGAALVVGLQWLSGGVEIVLATGVLMVAWELASLTPTPLVSRLRRLAAIHAGGLGVAAVQLLPACRAVLASRRGTGLDAANVLFWSVHPLRTLELVLPGLLGPVDRSPQLTPLYGGHLVDLGYPYIPSLYVGLTVLCLALVAAGRLESPVARRLRRALAAAVVTAVVVAWGRYVPGVTWLVGHLPGARTLRFPVKILALAGVPLAVLVACSVDALATARAGKRRVARTLGVGAVTLGLAWAAVALAAPIAHTVASWLFGAVSGEAASGLVHSMGHAALATIAAAAVALASGRWLRPAAAATLLAVTIAADLTVAAAPVLPSAPRSLLADEPRAAVLAASLRGDGRLFRGADPRDLRLFLPRDSQEEVARWQAEVLSYFLGATYGVPMVYNLDSSGLANRRIATLTDAVRSRGWRARMPLLAAAGVTVVLAPAGAEADGLLPVATIPNSSDWPYVLYRNERSLPPAWLAADAVWASTPDEALRRVLEPGFDPGRTVVLEGPPTRLDGAPSATARVEVVRRTPDSWRLRVATPRPAALVLSEPWDGQWRTSIDGDVVATLRANVAFSAVIVPAGRHLVERRYVPIWEAVGALLTLLSVGVLLVAGRVDRRRTAG